MSKELEALEEVNNLIDYYGEESTTYDSWQVIIEALTPPTAEEVCEALSEYFGFNYYYQDKFFYKSDGIKYIYPLKVSGFTEIQLYDGHLPPHLITMIGQFYESLEEVKEKI